MRKKKLSLSRETLSLLSAQPLQRAAGGIRTFIRETCYNCPSDRDTCFTCDTCLTCNWTCPGMTCETCPK